jgi:hypothetical protein
MNLSLRVVSLGLLIAILNQFFILLKKSKSRWVAVQRCGDANAAFIDAGEDAGR